MSLSTPHDNLAESTCTRTHSLIKEMPARLSDRECRARMSWDTKDLPGNDREQKNVVIKGVETKTLSQGQVAQASKHCPGSREKRRLGFWLLPTSIG